MKTTIVLKNGVSNELPNSYPSIDTRPLYISGPTAILVVCPETDQVLAQASFEEVEEVIFEP